jgi:hypothetical protein
MGVLRYVLQNLSTVLTYAVVFLQFKLSSNKNNN